MDLIKTVSEILKREVSEQEAKDFALDQFGVLSTHLLSKQVTLPTCLEDWAETHYMVSTALEVYINSPAFDEDANLLVDKRFREEGQGGLWLLSIELTNEFQTLHSDIIWGEELDFDENLTTFLTNKNQGL